METLTLVRKDSSPAGTFGELYRDGVRLCHTLEDPWQDNRPRMSCIPTGEYTVVRHGWEPDTTVKFKKTWHVLDVPGRNAILIHAGNTIDDTVGCILVGTVRGNIDGKPGIFGSKTAVEMLRQTLPEKFKLVVK